MKWISIKDKKPALNSRIIVKDDQDRIKLGWYKAAFNDKESNEDFNIYWILDDYESGERLTNITHWMPLPEVLQKKLTPPSSCEN